MKNKLGLMITKGGVGRLYDESDDSNQNSGHPVPSRLVAARELTTVLFFFPLRCDGTVMLPSCARMTDHLRRLEGSA
jgi:hypothetical protein